VSCSLPPPNSSLFSTLRASHTCFYSAFYTQNIKQLANGMQTQKDGPAASVEILDEVVSSCLDLYIGRLNPTVKIVNQVLEAGARQLKTRD